MQTATKHHHRRATRVATQEDAAVARVLPTCCDRWMWREMSMVMPRPGHPSRA